MTPSATENLADFTTLRVGGPTSAVAIATTTDEVADYVAIADANADALLILGGGSNVVIGDEGWPGATLLIRNRGVQWGSEEYDNLVTVAAGEPWDTFVAAAVHEGRSGVEALAGIPGRVGATPIQNVGAYGQEVAETIDSVLVWDRVARERRVLTNQDCAFAYRNSLFKRNPGKYVVLEVTFRLLRSTTSAPIRYRELAARIGVAVGESADLAVVHDTVLNLRRGKGMVLDDSDPDTFSAGSFFTNPILSKAASEQLPEDAPRFPTPGGVKTSAAWLIDNSGFPKGYGTGAARLSSKHTLALTNHDQATTDDVLALAREIRAGVQSRFGIALEPEPVLVNCSL